ncbi:hypothetical protein V502_10872 [Pseudogymnoascus sp. VKM F-4520 (FW-2644)]|nr:hypothetical protein V502_10872 [Pseudogymnoascus sp. VKM F-4520 (FW-2644)]
MWPAESLELDARYSAALQAAPAITVTSAGDPIRRPTPPVSAPAIIPSDSTARTSRGAKLGAAGCVQAVGLAALTRPERGMFTRWLYDDEVYVETAVKARYVETTRGLRRGRCGLPLVSVFYFGESHAGHWR